MKRLSKAVAALITLIIGLAFAHAQYFMNGGPWILTRTDVQSELKMSASQVEKVLQAINSIASGTGQSGSGQNSPPKPSHQGPLGDPVKALDLRLSQILSPVQYNRYEQLSLQADGPLTLLKPENASRIKLTDSQKRELEQIRMEANRSTVTSAGTGQSGLTVEKIRATRRKISDKVMAALDPSQRSKWKEMMGKPFAFSDF